MDEENNEFPRLEFPTQKDILKEISMFDRTISSAITRAINNKKREFDLKFEVWKAKKEDNEIMEMFSEHEPIFDNGLWL